MPSLPIISSTDFSGLFVQNVPMIDVRAPVEFQKGAFPAACNLPILNNTEREQVGIRYKESGPDAASDLGHRLVSGSVQASRIDGWLKYLAAHPNAVLYCFRGGQRSMIACDWLRGLGHEVPRIEGGFKQLRNHLLEVFNHLPPLVIVSGKTGTGKTEFLKAFRQSIDLEGIAHHRGSAFGSKINPQPAQINFENQVAIEFLKRQDEVEVLLEDESRLIGRINLPLPLQAAMKKAPILVLEESLDTRTTRIFYEYIAQQWQEYCDHFSAEAAPKFTAYLLGAMDAIRKRLGNSAHDQLRSRLVDAIDLHERTGSLESHKHWIRALLSDYYDPMYNYQLDKKAERVKAQGSRETISQWYFEHQGCLT